MVLDIAQIYNFSKVQSNLGKEAMPDSLGSARALANVVMRKKVGEVERFEDENKFTHKTEMGTATVYGNKGYRATWIYESEFNYVVKDNYYAFNNGIMYTCGVRYTVEKARGNFEDLEGRRFYLRRLCEEIIATSRLYYL